MVVPPVRMLEPYLARCERVVPAARGGALGAPRACRGVTGVYDSALSWCRRCGRSGGQGGAAWAAAAMLLGAV